MKQVYNFSFLESVSSNDFWQNRAFQYGDGLFETLTFRDGTVRFLADHYERLSRGMAALQVLLPTAFSVAYLDQTIRELARQHALEANARVKIQVWRQPGGLYTPASTQADFLITITTLAATGVTHKEKVIFYEDFRLFPSPLSEFKTCSALPYVMAGLARKEAGADEVILLDVHGNLAECVASNLFWLKGSTLYTPSLATGCIAGIMRKQILQRAPAYGLAAVEGLFPKEVFLAAEAVFCCNVAGIQWLTQVEGHCFQTENHHPALVQLLKDAV